MTLKVARNPSADPVQEKLREDKAVWNKNVSLFINDVIHLKKLMNGWPSKFYKERSRIIEPIPADPNTILGSLANDFQELSQKGRDIVTEQLNYTKNRRVKQPKTNNTPGAPATPEAPPSDLSKQLAAWDQKYNLVTEGSNPLSRFLVRRITRTRGLDDRAHDNRIRMDMLKSSVKAYKALGKLQVYIVSGSKNSVSDAYKMMQLAWHEWSIVARSLNTFKLLTKEPDDTPYTDLPEEKNNQEPSLEFNAPVNPVVTPELTKKETDIVEVPKKSPDEPDLAKSASDYYIQVLSQAFVKKWLGKTRQQLFPQSNSSYRLEIFKLATQVRKDINLVMNSLEKGLDYNQLSNLISQVNRQISSLKMLMRSLHLSDKPATSDMPLWG